MEIVLVLLTLQGLLGGLDNLWHHELSEQLPKNPTAKGELALHSAREFLYGVIFTSIAWVTWNGTWAYVLLAIMGVEIVITLWDFIIEDQTRKLPKFERVLHTILAINFGAVLAYFVPAVWGWAGQADGFAPAYYGLYSWILTAYGIGVFAWGVRDFIASYLLWVPEWRRHPFIEGVKDVPLRVLVTGATGFIGRGVTRALIERGDRPVVLTRNPALARYMFGPYVDVVDDLDLIPAETKLDGIINLAGAPIIGLPWTAARRRLLLESRVGTTAALARLARRLVQPPRVLVSGSAIGFYGVRGDEALTETDAPQDIFMSRLCQVWEQAAIDATVAGMRVCRLRIGLVFGADGGALPQFALPARFGLGTVFGSGQQWVSWIHKADLIRLILFAVDNDAMQGAINATAPEPVTQRAFTDALCAVLKRPHFFRMPAWAMRRVIGEQAGLFVDGQKVLPLGAQTHGFTFAFPECEGALNHLLKGARGVPMNRVGKFIELRANMD